MLEDLDLTLKHMLENEVKLDGDKKLAVSFHTPDGGWEPDSLPAVNLFLYDVRENRDLRSVEWVIERNKATKEATLTRPPVRVDCSYLVTAWAGDAGGEHRLLGQVMRVLIKHPVLPSTFLQGDLKNQDPALPATTLQPGRLQSVAEFWQAMGGKPKVALNYTVTIGVTPIDEEPVKATLVDHTMTIGVRPNAEKPDRTKVDPKEFFEWQEGRKRSSEADE